MPKRTFLSQAPPFAVESAIQQLGGNLRTARLRRGLTIAEVAQKIGAGVRAVSDAEHGKATTAVSVYVALLWLYGLLPALEEVASPLKDEEGLRLTALREPRRARGSRERLDNDF
ncbi:MAG: helix-turn-helix transcriptional regulator [Coriobacteriales bacterium]|nr:helix-turn-helix transcriptional regulator [Coriobacteriales bacterium]